MWPIRRAAVFLASTAFVALGAGSARASDGLPGCTGPEGGKAPGELALESRLIAPCCDSPQTLDVHQSPSALALRSEIHARLCAGETSESIEADLVRRHGEGIRAAPRTGLKSVAVPVVGGVVLSSSAALLVLALRRWRRRSEQAGPSVVLGGTLPPRDEDDERLDEELRRLDPSG